MYLLVATVFRFYVPVDRGDRDTTTSVISFLAVKGDKLSYVFQLELCIFEAQGQLQGREQKRFVEVAVEIRSRVVVVRGISFYLMSSLAFMEFRPDFEGRA